MEEIVCEKCGAKLPLPPLGIERQGQGHVIFRIVPPGRDEMECLALAADEARAICQEIEAAGYPAAYTVEAGQGHHEYIAVVCTAPDGEAPAPAHQRMLAPPVGETYQIATNAKGC